MSWHDSQRGSIVVDDRVVRFHRFGPRGGHPLLLIHGGSGHSGWWFQVAPTLARTRDVIIPDLTGHGDSEHRGHYTPEVWAREVEAVIADAGAGPADVVGHSMGGFIGIYLAANAPGSVRSLVVIDTPVKRKVPGVDRASTVRYYATLDEGLANFRLRPRGTSASPELLADVARAGLRETPQGWRWKFDPGAMMRFSMETVQALAERIDKPVGFIYGDSSELVDSTTVERLAEILGRDVPHVKVAGAFHHVPLDAPQETAEAITWVLDEL